MGNEHWRDGTAGIEGMMNKFVAILEKQAAASSPSGVWLQVSGIELKGLIQEGIKRLKRNLKATRALALAEPPDPLGRDAVTEAVAHLRTEIRHCRWLAEHLSDTAVMKLSEYEARQYLSIGGRYYPSIGHGTTATVSPLRTTTAV